MARIYQGAFEKYVARGRTLHPAFSLPQFGDPDWDETELAVRVDCVEGDEEVMKTAARRARKNDMRYVLQ